MTAMEQTVNSSGPKSPKSPKSIPVLKKSSTAVSLPIPQKYEPARSLEEGCSPKKNRPKSAKSLQNIMISGEDDASQQTNTQNEHKRRSPSNKFRRKNGKEESTGIISTNIDINNTNISKGKRTSPPSPNSKDKTNGDEGGDGKKKNKDSSSTSTNKSSSIPARKNSAPPSPKSSEAEMKIKRKVKEEKQSPPNDKSSNNKEEMKSGTVNIKKSKKMNTEKKSPKDDTKKGNAEKKSPKDDTKKKKEKQESNDRLAKSDGDIQKDRNKGDKIDVAARNVKELSASADPIGDIKFKGEDFQNSTIAGYRNRCGTQELIMTEETAAVLDDLANFAVSDRDN